MYQFIVIGNPIAHSKSPVIHQQFASQFKLDIDYQKCLLETDDFNRSVKSFFTTGHGANITVPFKEMAYQLAENHSQEAKLAQSVNTLYLKDGYLFGDNTDGIGLIKDITKNHNIDIKDKSILVLGAGGAAKGVIYPLIQQQPKSITITNRTFEKAQQLAKQFSAFFNVDSITLTSLSEPKSPVSFDIIINATSASLSGNTISLNNQLFNDQTFAYDMMYSKVLSPFLQQAKSQNAIIADGLGMLVEQAARSFELWLGKAPKTQPVIAAIRQQIQE